MEALSSLFKILAVLYAFRSVQLGAIIWREWSQIRREPLTHRKKQLAEQAAIFLSVPFGVLVHEAAHALATWSVGGEVLEFNYGLFYGSVLPYGQFTAAQDWFIAVAGTLGSLLFGLVVWAITHRSSSTSVRYFGLRTFRFQIYFSLLYYPIFTLLGFNGDWRTIYDFNQTPFLSGATAVVHIVSLVAFYRFDRGGHFEQPAFVSLGAQESFNDLRQKRTLSPQDAGLQLAYVDALRTGGARNKAKTELRAFLAAHPHSAEGHLIRALLELQGQRDVSKPAAEGARRALDLGLSTPSQEALAHEIVARHDLEVGDADSAAQQLTFALDSTSRAPVQTDMRRQIELYLYRNQAYRRLGRYDEAFADISKALGLAQKVGGQALVGRVREQLEILQKHSGRSFASLLPEQVP